MQITSFRIKELEACKLLTLEKNHGYYCLPTSTYNHLLDLEEIPIKNREIFLRNVLQFLEYLAWKSQAKENSNDPTLIPIHRDEFVNYFGIHHYVEYKKILHKFGVITAVPDENGKFYGKGEFSTSYRIHSNYFRTSDITLVIIDYGRQKLNRLTIIETQIHPKFLKCLREAEIDVLNAIRAELAHASNERSLTFRISAILNLVNHRYAKKGSFVNRIYNSFASLSKIARPFLTVDGKKFRSIDLVNAQPLFLAYYLNKKDLPVDETFLEDVQIGYHYDKFCRIEKEFYVSYRSADKILDRDTEVKPLIYKNVYFGFDENQPINKKFKSLYPMTWESIKNLGEDNQTLASTLQNMEASVFNSLVPKYSDYFFLVFDSIYFTEVDDNQYLTDKLLDKFVKYDIVPSFKYSDSYVHHTA